MVRRERSLSPALGIALVALLTLWPPVAHAGDAERGADGGPPEPTTLSSVLAGAEAVADGVLDLLGLGDGPGLGFVHGPSGPLIDPNGSRPEPSGPPSTGKENNGDAP